MSKFNLNDKVKNIWRKDWGLGKVTQKFQFGLVVTFENKGDVAYTSKELKFLDRVA